MQKRHQPYHIYLDNQIYFLSAHTYLSQYKMKTEGEKQKILEKIKSFFNEFNIILYAWAILENHYHLLFKTLWGKNLPKAIGKIHAGYSFEINQLQGCRGRKIWQNYWDWCIRSEKDFWTHFNYIHHNAVKHGYVNRVEDYKFTSFHYWVKKRGREWVMSIFEQYPIIDFTVDRDEF